MQVKSNFKTFSMKTLDLTSYVIAGRVRALRLDYFEFSCFNKSDKSGIHFPEDIS